MSPTAKAGASPPCAFRRRLTRGESTPTPGVGIYGAKGLPTSRSTTSARSTKPACSRRSSKTCHRSLAAPVIERTGAQSGDLIFFGADKAKIVAMTPSAPCASRSARKGFVTGAKWAPLWVIDFPMFEYDDESKRWTACHPFTSPKDEHLDLLVQRSGKCLAKPTTWR